jgi:hypothetical protein
MKATILCLAALVALVGLGLGCEMLNMDVTTSPSQEREHEYHVDVWIDGQQARMEMPHRLLARSVSATPTVRYELRHPEKIGKVRSVIINIFPEFDGGWSNQAAYAIFATDTNNPGAQMQAGEVYDLGSLGDEFRAMGPEGGMVDTVSLESGRKYLMNFVVSGDGAETASIVFTVE